MRLPMSMRSQFHEDVKKRIIYKVETKHAWRDLLSCINEGKPLTLKSIIEAEIDDEGEDFDVEDDADISPEYDESGLVTDPDQYDADVEQLISEWETLEPQEVRNRKADLLRTDPDLLRRYLMYTGQGYGDLSGIDYDAPATAANALDSIIDMYYDKNYPKEQFNRYINDLRKINPQLYDAWQTYLKLNVDNLSGKPIPVSTQSGPDRRGGSGSTFNYGQKGYSSWDAARGNISFSPEERDLMQRDKTAVSPDKTSWNQIPNFDPDYELKFIPPDEEEGETDIPPNPNDFNGDKVAYDKAVAEFKAQKIARAIPPNIADYRGRGNEYHKDKQKFDAAIQQFQTSHDEPQQWISSAGKLGTGAVTPDNAIWDPGWAPEYDMVDTGEVDPDGNPILRRSVVNVKTPEDRKKFFAYQKARGMPQPLDSYAAKMLAKKSYSGDSIYQQAYSSLRATGIPHEEARNFARTMANKLSKQVLVSDMPVEAGDSSGEGGEGVAASALPKEFEEPSYTATYNMRPGESSEDREKADPAGKNIKFDDSDQEAIDRVNDFIRWVSNRPNLKPLVLEYLLAMARWRGFRHLDPDMESLSDELFGDNYFRDDSKGGKVPTADFAAAIVDKNGVPATPDRLRNTQNELKELVRKYQEEQEGPEDNIGMYARPIKLKGVVPGQTLDPFRMSESETLPIGNKNFVPPSAHILNQRLGILNSDITKLNRVLSKYKYEVEMLKASATPRAAHLLTGHRKKHAPGEGPVDFPALESILERTEEALSELEAWKADTLNKLQYLEDEGFISTQKHKPLGSNDPKVYGDPSWDSQNLNWSPDLPSEDSQPVGKHTPAAKAAREFDEFMRKIRPRGYDPEGDDIKDLRDQYIRLAGGKK